AERVLKEVNERLRFLVDVGLDYLSLNRAAGTRRPVAHTAPAHPGPHAGSRDALSDRTAVAATMGG
ncbi:hypothetical protein, partial [Streptomyces sp. NPDC051098]|uniref:hypothetical protein n=1 Tax=Streptomyces sp. NPDC051098 TaxID=3155411 RepID=UPI003448FBB8